VLVVAWRRPVGGRRCLAVGCHTLALARTSSRLHLPLRLPCPLRSIGAVPLCKVGATVPGTLAPSCASGSTKSLHVHGVGLDCLGRQGGGITMEGWLPLATGLGGIALGGVLGWVGKAIEQRRSWDLEKNRDRLSASGRRCQRLWRG
jgi:hypothetical protein